MRYLGVILDESFSFCHHTLSSTTKAKQELGVPFRKVARLLPSGMMLRICKQKILPQLTYGLVLASLQGQLVAFGGHSEVHALNN